MAKAKNKYYALEMVAFIYLCLSSLTITMGILIIISGIILGISSAIVSEDSALVLLAVPFLGPGVALFLMGVFLFATKEFIHLAIRVEENTRETAQLLFTLKTKMSSSSGGRLKKQRLDDFPDFSNWKEDSFDEEHSEDVFEEPPTEIPELIPELDVVKSIPESIELHCPNCGNTAKAPSKVLGRKIRCQKCKAEFNATL